jgi:CBS domain-containing protein
MHVSDILKEKGNKVATIRADVSIRSAAQKLKIEGVGVLVVSEDGKSVDGILSERDIAHGLAEHGGEIAEQNVADLMTRGVIHCVPQDSIAHIAKVMTQRRIRHLPVMEGRTLIGIVSIGDVVRHRLDELELEANVLRDYATVRH